MSVSELLGVLSEMQNRFQQFVRVHESISQTVNTINLEHDALRTLVAPLEAMKRILDQQAAITKALQGPAIYMGEPIAYETVFPDFAFDFEAMSEYVENEADLESEPPRRQVGFRLDSTEEVEKRDDEPPAVS